MVTTNSSRPKWLRRAGLVVGLVAAGWWVFFGIASGIGEGLDFVGALVHTALPGLIFLASVAVAWRWEPIGGVFLIVEGLFVSVAYSIVFGHCPLMTIVLVLLTMSLPLLASGVLFLLSPRKGG